MASTVEQERKGQRDNELPEYVIVDAITALERYSIMLSDKNAPSMSRRYSDSALALREYLKARAGLSVEQEETPLTHDLGEPLVHEPSGCKCVCGHPEWQICSAYTESPETGHGKFCISRVVDDGVLDFCAHDRACHTPSSLVEK